MVIPRTGQRIRGGLHHGAQADRQFRSIPLGTAYAVWTGAGAIGTVAIGMIWFDEPATIMRVLLVLGIVGCVVGLKFTSGE
ncbi:MAG: small multidrug resistance family (SMR) protein [uncultured Sphingomonadaceae bacterium]|uniref:Guanidinium exporter n=1 Tax=uncultured Sphingomonadaceae bacterium TaxID=169976 RepID=A0A6J4SUX1_9SPHN|nr:MAG: small multidrug resistance family (SMR) protein [uncultured Sphingomonadaceae bacterium]